MVKRTSANGKASKAKSRSSANGAAYKVTRKRLASLKPSPENKRLYRPTNEDPEIDRLVASIRERGLIETPIVTGDSYIVSGHRRRAALLRLGKVWQECRVLPYRREDIPTDEYIKLLREHNVQREKTVAEYPRPALLRAEV
jgi:ParB-like chromosome segregation protein Spo0J